MSKRDSIASDKPSEPSPAAGVRASPPAPGPRPSRGAAVIQAPRKAEVHRLVAAPRPPPTREQVAARAYEIWMNRGCIPGRDAENWLQAELELLAGC